MSKIFQFISFSSGVGIFMFGSIYMSIICIIFYSNNVYDQASICLIIYGLYFILQSLYYIPPSIIDIETKSKPILMIYLISSSIYLISYLVLIPLIGIVGIPCASILGNLSFVTICAKRIKKNNFTIGFDSHSLKKITIASIPAMSALPFSYLISKFFQVRITLTILYFNFEFPILAFILTIVLAIFIFVPFIFILKKLKFFEYEDNLLFNQLIGTRFGKIISKIFISKN